MNSSFIKRKQHVDDRVLLEGRWLKSFKVQVNIVTSVLLLLRIFIFLIVRNGGNFEYWKAELEVVLIYVWWHVQRDLKSRGSIDNFVSFREMITSQLQGKLWLYVEVPGGEYVDSGRSPYEDRRYQKINNKWKSGPRDCSPIEKKIDLLNLVHRGSHHLLCDRTPLSPRCTRSSSNKVLIGVLNHLESIRRNFFYGVDDSDRKLAWIGWNMVLTSKKNGGLGVSSFFAHNRALFFKWVWRFLTDGSSLWTRFIKAIFGNKGALDTHKLIPRRSPWQDVILAIHSLQSKGINLMDFIQKKVGNGENTSFWDDSWLGEVALKVLYKRLYALEMCKSISVAEKMGHPSLSHSFRRMPRGGVEQENYGLLCSKVADLVLPNISDR
ncbi:hypothetical protein Tco_0880766 [Tanacetum coccineum]